MPGQGKDVFFFSFFCYNKLIHFKDPRFLGVFAWTEAKFAILALWPTSTTENPPWPTASWSRPRPSPCGRWKTSCWTTWTWSGSGASPSRPTPSLWCTPPRTGRTTSSTSSTPPAMWTSTTRCPALWPPARGPCWWWTPPRASRPRPWPTPTWPWTPGWRSCRWSTK